MQVSGNKLIDTSPIASKMYVGDSDCSSDESGASSKDVPFFRGSAITVIPCSKTHLDSAIREMKLYFKEESRGNGLTMNAVKRACEAINEKVMSRVRMNGINLEFKLDFNFKSSWGTYHERLINLAGKFDKMTKWNSQKLWEKFESVLENNVGDKFEALKKEFHGGEFHSEEFHGQFDSMLKLVTSALMADVDCKAFLNALCSGGLETLVKEFVLIEVPSSERPTRVREGFHSRSNSLPQRRSSVPQRRSMVLRGSEQPENKAKPEIGKAKSAENLKGNPIKLRQRQDDMLSALKPFQRSAQSQQSVVSKCTRIRNIESSSVVSSAASTETSKSWLNDVSNVNQSSEQSPTFNNERKENWQKALEAFADDYDNKNSNETDLLWDSLMPYLKESLGDDNAWSLRAEVTRLIRDSQSDNSDQVRLGRMRPLVEVVFRDRLKKNQEYAVGGEVKPVETIDHTLFLGALFRAGYGDQIRGFLPRGCIPHDQSGSAGANAFSRATKYKDSGTKLSDMEQDYPTRSASFGSRTRRPSLIQRIKSSFKSSKSKSTNQISKQD